MPRGNASQCKVHLKGETEDFIVFVESKEALQEWRKDKSVPLAQVVDGFKIFITHKHGNQGTHDTPSKGQLEDEFKSSKDDDVIPQILERGNIVESENAGRGGDKNISQGPTVAH